ncbi:MAG: hypothetical protein RLZZ01_1246 [Actinomycetota bacterium]
MSGRLSGSGVGDLLVDRETVFRWAEESLHRPGVHLLVAEQGFGAPAVVDHCRRVVPDVAVGRCHTGVLVPPMSPFLEALDLAWPGLADPVGFVATAGVDGSPEAVVPWSESPSSLIDRMRRSGDGRPLIVVDGHEALPSVVEALVRLGEASERPVLVVAQPWHDRGHRVDWLDGLVPSLTDRLELQAATPDAAWEWFESATRGTDRPAWAADARALWSLTQGVPLLVGMAAHPDVLASADPTAVFDVGRRIVGLGRDARRLAEVLALADMSPLPVGTVDPAAMFGWSAEALDEVLGELRIAGLVRPAGAVRGGDVGPVGLSDPMWADAVLSTAVPGERRELQVMLLERAIAVGAPPAMVAVHLAEIGWSVASDADRLESAVLATGGSPESAVQWLDLVEQERPSDGAEGFGRAAARMAARFDRLAALERPSVPAVTALRVERALRAVEVNGEHRGRRAMAYGKLMAGEHDRAIVDVLDLREESGRGQAWASLTADLAMMYLMAGRFVLSERSAAEAWADLRGEPAVRAVAGVLLSVVRLVRGDLTSASAVCDEATVMLDLLDRPPVSPMPVHLLAAMVRLGTDRHAEALRLVEAGLAAARATDSTWGLAGHRGLAARVWLRQGKLDAAERLASLAMELPDGSDGFRTEGWWVGVLAWLEWLRGGDPTEWLSSAAGRPMNVVRVGSEVLGLVSALHRESSGDPAGAAQDLAVMFEETLGIGAVSALSEGLPTAARLAVVVDDERLRSVVGRVLDVRSLGAVEVPSRRAEYWAARAWLDGDLGRMRAAFERADGAASMLLGAELASDGALLARRLGDASSARWFGERALERWTAIGVPEVAGRRAARSATG